MRGHECWSCGGSGGEDVLEGVVVVWQACYHCLGTGIEPVPDQVLEAHEAQQREDDEFCESNGHGPGCPHDTTDWDSIVKERYL